MQKAARHITRALAACALLLCAPGATGSAQGEPETTVLRDARMFDATSERMRPDAVIVLRRGPIVAHGSESTLPANARTIHLDRKSTRMNYMNQCPHHIK